MMKQAEKFQVAPVGVTSNNNNPADCKRQCIGGRSGGPRVWVLALTFLLLLAFNASATNWYVRTGATGSNNGSDWNNAWSISGINWGSVRGGDTIWLGGGKYSAGINVGASGSSGSPITIKRATSKDSAPTGAAGWSSALDSQAVITEINDSQFSYITIDGNSTYGIQVLMSSNGGVGIQAAYSGNVSNLKLLNIEVKGPYSSAPANVDGIQMVSASYTFTDSQISNCWVHGICEGFRAFNWNNVVVEHCFLADFQAASNEHMDVMYAYPISNTTFRYNTISNSPADGIFFEYGGAQNFYFYGNVFVNSQNHFIQTKSPGNYGPLYIYNNVFYAASASTYGWISFSGTTDPATKVYNNVFWNVQNSCGAGGSVSSDYNAYNNWNYGGYSIPTETHGIKNLSNPWVDVAGGNFRLISGAALMNKGMAQATDGYINKDMDGVTRGGDGTWDIGAFEYSGASLVVSPSSLDFGSIAPNANSTNSFTIKNAGAGTLTGSATVAAPFYIVSGGTYSLGANQSQTVTIRYSPTTAGTSAQTVSFTGGNGSSAQVTGTAVATTTPVISVSPSSVNFGSISVGATADQTVTVKNTGTGTLSGNASAAAPFSIVSGSPYSLAAGASQVVTIRYSPTAVGTNNQSVSFTGGNGATVQATAQAAALPAISATPSSVNYGTVTVGATADQTITIKNTGGGTLSGSASVAAPFSIVSGSPYSLASGQSQNVVVRYSPTVAGSSSQSVSFTGGNGASTLLSATAVNPPTISVNPTSLNFGSISVGSSADKTFSVQNTGSGTLSGSASVGSPFSIVSGGSYSLIAGQSQTVTVRYTPTAAGTNTQSVTLSGANACSLPLTAVATAPAAITVTPSSLNFGSIALGSSADLTVTVQNSGSATLSGSASVAAPFSIVSGSPYNLAAGQSQVITVRYTPTVAGTNVQTMALTGGNGASCQLTGSSSAVPAIGLTPSSVSFGAIAVGSSADRTISVQNTGGGTLSGSASVTVPFSIVSGSPYSLAAGQSQVVTVRYSPTTAGTNTQVATFTGGNGATAQVTGSAASPAATNLNLNFAATSGTITSPFTSSSGYISQPSETILTAGGQAVYNFRITNAGSYEIQAVVNAASLAANSIWVNIDSQPQDPSMIWDIPITTGFQANLVGWRGTGTFDKNQYVPKVFNLSAGLHQLIVVGREANVQLQSFKIVKVPSPPHNLRVTP